MRITFLGHAAVLLEGSRRVLIDPFLKDNPSAACAPSAIEAVDFIVITHDHFDHVGDSVEIAARTGAVIVAIHEVAMRLSAAYPQVKTVGMNIGETYQAGGVIFSMTPAVHSSGSGAPAGMVIALDGCRIYHAGDTAYFSDMTLIPDLYGEIDLACLPIGGHYVMDIRQAAMATRAIHPKVVVPIHFGTWPTIAADPSMLEAAVKPTRVNAMKPGESLDL